MRGELGRKILDSSCRGRVLRTASDNIAEVIMGLFKVTKILARKEE